MKRTLLFGIIVLTCLALASCGSSGTNGAGGEETTSTTTSNPLSSTFPGDLVVTSPFASSATQANVAVKSLVTKASETEMTGSGTIKPYEERKTEIQEQLVGSSQSDCAFSLNLFKLASESNCYAPNITYHNHQDGADRINTGDTEPRLPGGDTGLWAEYDFTPEGGSTGEACAASKLNNLISNVSFKVDTAIGMFSGMLCMAKVDGVAALPAIDETKDMKTSFDKVAADVGNLTITAATVTRESDNSEGKKVYLSHIQATIAASQTTQAILDIFLRHIPLDDDNTTYKGKLWYKMTSETGALPAMTPNCGIGDNAKMIASSILYSKTDATHLSYHVRSAAYCESNIDPFDAKHNLRTDLKESPADNTRGWAGNFQMGTFLLNPSDGTGDVSFAWQAGPQDNWTRTFITQVASANSRVSGCGYFGFGPDVAANGAGDITGFICNWTGPGSHAMSDKEQDRRDLAQKQCMTRDAATGLFKSDTINISYAPSFNCNVDAGHENFIFQSGFGSDGKSSAPSGITNNDKTNGTVTLQNNLVNVSEVPTPPTQPADIE